MRDRERHLAMLRAREYQRRGLRKAIALLDGLIAKEEGTTMPRPVIIALDPFTLNQDDPEQWVQVYGEGFEQATWKQGKLTGPQVLFDGQEADTQYLGGDTLRVRVRPSDFQVGDVLAKVRNPDGMETSWCVPLHVLAPIRQPQQTER